MLQFNLRTKLIIGFTAFLLVASYINIVFLKDFGSFQKNVRTLTHASNISNLSLEIRRYEKNYIMKQEIEDYNIATDFINKILDYLSEVENDIDVEDQIILSDIKNEIDQYQIHFEALRGTCVGEPTAAECNSEIEPIQILGADIVKQAEALVRDSQLKVENFAKTSKIHLILYFTFLIVFSLCGMVVFLVTIARRLKFLEIAANAIATGNYDSLPVSKLNDEVQVVFKAFDRMVTDLEERQEMLFQAEKLSSIGTLASGMAHQLNNPLNNIATSCQLAVDEASDNSSSDFLKKLLKTINEETIRAAEIVRGLLEFSRHEVFLQKPTSIKQVIKQVVSLVLSELPSGIEIIQDIPEDLDAPIDEQKIKEVFLNLIINSIQAISDPTGTIVIAAEIDVDTNWIVITVSDTGIGIDEEVRQKIFDPFYTTKEVGEGTGLGLSVVYGIINKHKGTITVRNNKDKGSTFIISLPHV
jgi:signal transduction histidine kinase